MIWASYVLTNVLSLKTKIDFDVIGESRTKKNNSPINSIILKDYFFECFPTESLAGDTLL